MPTADEDPSPNIVEGEKPRTEGQSRAEQSIEKLRTRGGIFVEAVRATRTPMVLTDPNLAGNPIVFANQAFLDLSGYSMEEVLGQQASFLNGPETDPKDAQRFKKALDEDRDVSIETVQYTKSGSRIVTAVFLSAFKEDGGRTLHHFLSWYDVTDRVAAETELGELRKLQAALKDSEQHANMLFAELQHRVRNTLAVVRSIARRTAESSRDVESMLAHFQGRLDAFSRVQSALTRSADGKVDLATIIEDELVAHATRDGEQVRIEGPSVAIDSRIAERMSLAIHELTTNAVKHGALVNAHGRIGISWENGHDRLRLRWEESGVNVRSRSIRREGFGMELLRRSLPYDLNAETRIELRANKGLFFEVDMPLGQRDVGQMAQ